MPVTDRATCATPQLSACAYLSFSWRPRRRQQRSPFRRCHHCRRPQPCPRAPRQAGPQATSTQAIGVTAPQLVSPSAPTAGIFHLPGKRTAPQWTVSLVSIPGSQQRWRPQGPGHVHWWPQYGPLAPCCPSRRPVLPVPNPAVATSPRQPVGPGGTACSPLSKCYCPRQLRGPGNVTVHYPATSGHHLHQQGWPGGATAHSPATWVLCPLLTRVTRHALPCQGDVVPAGQGSQAWAATAARRYLLLLRGARRCCNALPQYTGPVPMHPWARRARWRSMLFLVVRP